MSYHQILMYLDSATVTVLVVLLGRFAWAVRKSPNAWLVVMLCLVGIAYVLSTRQDYGPLLPAAYTFDFGSFHVVLNLLRNSGSGVFALLCHRIFRAGTRLPLWLPGLLVLQLLLEEPVEWLIGPAWIAANPHAARLLLEVLPASLQITLMGLALYWILAGREEDLVEARRRVRVVLYVLYGLQAVLSLGLERIAFGLGLVPVAWMYPIHVVSVTVAMVATLGIVWLLMPANVVEFIDPTRAAPAPEPLERDTSEVDAARIRRALQHDQIYRQAGLTVAAMAGQLALPEYRLRRLIHERLGFRNFNALLHEYRIAEVCEALADPEQNGTPVLTLALSAGYQSLTPFNRAFKSLKGVTPTEYRHQAQKSLSEN